MFGCIFGCCNCFRRDFGGVLLPSGSIVVTECPCLSLVICEIVYVQQESAFSLSYPSSLAQLPEEPPHPDAP